MLGPVLEGVRLRLEPPRPAQILASVYSGNDASLRVLAKAGFRQAGLLRRHAFFGGEWHDEWLGEVLREDWKEGT